MPLSIILFVDVSYFVQDAEYGNRTAKEQEKELKATVIRKLIHYDSTSQEVAKDYAWLVGRHSVKLRVENQSRRQVQKIQKGS